MMKKNIFMSPRRRLLLVFAACFAVSQAINLWSSFPQYGGWHVFGFPLLYFQFQEGAGFLYFNILFLLVDLLVWYAVAKVIMLGYGQLTKYKILK